MALPFLHYKLPAERAAFKKQRRLKAHQATSICFLHRRSLLSTLALQLTKPRCCGQCSLIIYSLQHAYRLIQPYQHAWLHRSRKSMHDDCIPASEFFTIWGDTTKLRFCERGKRGEVIDRLERRERCEVGDRPFLQLLQDLGQVPRLICWCSLAPLHVYPWMRWAGAGIKRGQHQRPKGRWLLRAMSEVGPNQRDRRPHA